MDFEVLTKNLEKKGYKVSCFATKEEAAAYLNKEIDGMTVSSGGSMTVKELGLADMLRTHNDFKWHWEGDDRMDVLATDVYLSSVNGIAETGEIVNIDGMGNRLAGTLFGHKKLYFIVGKNKIAKDLDGAIRRARNIAAPKNAMRFNVKTPCVASGGEKCFDCKSPERICKALLVFWERPNGIKDTEVVLIDEDLGY
ncbi:MAG: lactate utilization protein [Firmicutes bacterium]|nr:lactate utilization protein [Bacillota bacterium]